MSKLHNEICWVESDFLLTTEEKQRYRLAGSENMVAVISVEALKKYIVSEAWVDWEDQCEGAVLLRLLKELDTM